MMLNTSSDGGGNAMKIKVYRTVKQVLHRITSRREYALITTKLNIKDSKDSVLIRFISSDDSSVNNYVYVGRPVFSRERFDKDECFAQIRKTFPSINAGQVSFPEIDELYKISEGKFLVIDIKGNDMEAVNQKWICKCLQFTEAEREKYLSDDYVSVKLSLSRIKGRRVRRKDEEPVPVDIADYEIYDRMIDVLYRIDKEQHYGDACCIEYSIVPDEYEYRYFVTHFFFNHNWCRDPQNLLNICFSAEILSGSCSREKARFSHPSKITNRKSDGTEYLIETITMDNSCVSTKFRDGDTHEPSEDDASGSRTYDNPVDFAMWVDLYHQEIRMA